MTDLAIILPAANGGGAERAVISVANRFVRAGLKVDIVLVRRAGPFLREIDPGARIVDLAAGRISRALPALHRYMQGARPALLLSALVGTDVLVLVGKALFRWQTHLHVSIQNSPTASAGVSQDKLARHWPLLIKLIYRFADSISAISSGLARDVEALMKRASGSVPVIYNPVDIPHARLKAAEAPEHPWLARKCGPVVLAAGRLVRQKDFPTLLEAFHRVVAVRTDAKLIVLGEGPDRAMLEAQAAELGVVQSVSFPGFSDNPFAAMAAADVFVLTSRWEGFANVVAEALACGAKVVSTDCPSGPAEILEGGRWGVLVPVGGAPALAEAILGAFDNQVDRNALMRRSEAFSLDQIVQSYRSLFHAEGVLQ